MKMTPAAPGWVLMPGTPERGGESYDIVGWTEENEPVIATGSGITEYRLMFGEDPYAILTEVAWREDYR